MNRQLGVNKTSGTLAHSVT